MRTRRWTDEELRREARTMYIVLCAAVVFGVLCGIAGIAYVDFIATWNPIPFLPRMVLGISTIGYGVYVIIKIIRDTVKDIAKIQ